MSERTNLQSSEWAKELRATIAAIEAAMRTLATLNEHTRNAPSANGGVPREIPENIHKLLSKLNGELNTALESSKSSFDRYSGNPVMRLFTKKDLSREEYFLLQAMGATEAELPEPTWSRKNASNPSFPDAG